MDCFGTAISMGLQYGVPLEVFVNKFAHSRFEPVGFTKNPDIRIAKSIVDYIFRWLGMEFIPGYREANNGNMGHGEAAASAAEDVPGETKPVARTSGGPNAGAGSPKAAEAKSAVAKTNGHGPVPKPHFNGNGNGHANGHGLEAKTLLLERTELDLTPRVRARANSSPASRPTHRAATTAVPSPSATAIAISVTTAGTAWAARNGLSGFNARGPVQLRGGPHSTWSGVGPAFCARGYRCAGAVMMRNLAGDSSREGEDYASAG